MNKYLVTVHYVIEKKYYISADSAEYIEGNIDDILSTESYEGTDDGSWVVSDVEVYEIEYAEEVIEEED